MTRPLFEEQVLLEGRSYRVAWFDPPFAPPPEQTRQALGICFAADRRIVLVAVAGDDWSLPGGTIEPGETPVDALRREVREEACAQVVDCAYVGCQRVEPLDEPVMPYYEARFWARVELAEFVAEHETTAEARAAGRLPRDTALGTHASCAANPRAGA